MGESFVHKSQASIHGCSVCLWQAAMAPVAILLHLHLLRASRHRRSGCTSLWPSSARGSTSSPGTRCRQATTASKQSRWCTASTPAPPQGWRRHGAASNPQWIRRTWKKAGRNSPSFIILQLNSLRLRLFVTLYNYTATTSPFFLLRVVPVTLSPPVRVTM